MINEKGDILGRLSCSYGSPEGAVAPYLKSSRHLLFHGLGFALGAVSDRPHVSTDLLIVFEKKVGNVLIRINGDGALLIDLGSPIPILAEAHTETNKVYLPIYKSRSLLALLIIICFLVEGALPICFSRFNSSSFKSCLNFITFGW